MSIQYDKILHSNPKNTLKVNISGFKDGTIDPNNLKLSLYAYDSSSGSPIFRKTMHYDDIADLYNYLNSISIVRDNTRSITHKFIELDRENIHIVNLIVSGDNQILKKILQKVESVEKQQLLLNALTNAELVDLGAAIKQSQHTLALKCLNELLELESTGELIHEIANRTHLLEYQAAQPEKVFQNWIEKNLWSLGVDYIKRHSGRKIGISTESDLMMESTDGFIDLIELKRPKFPILSFDDSHKCYYPSKELAKVLGQCLHYLKKMDEYKHVLEKEYKCKVLRPRIKIVIGRSNDFDDFQYEALRMLNSNLSHIEVISYDYLLSCGETITSFYKHSSDS